MVSDLKLGRIVSRAIFRSRAYKQYREAVRWELSMSGYTGIYALDDEKIFGEIKRTVCGWFSDRLSLDPQVVEDAVEDYWNNREFH